MENININKNRIRHFWKEKKYTSEGIKNINHTNINNNINITNYYPSPSENYCNKRTITFINENSIIQNVINYPIKTTTHRTQKIQAFSPASNIKKFHQCQSPYMKKILTNSNRQKSEESNRIVNVLKNSSSSRYAQPNKKRLINAKKFYNNLDGKINLNNFNSNKQNIYLNTSNDESIHKMKSNRNNDLDNNYHCRTILGENINSDKNPQMIKFGQTLMTYRTNNKNNIFHLVEKPIERLFKKKRSFQSISSYECDNLITYNTNSLKLLKNKDSNIIKNNNSTEKKMKNKIILIQAHLRGFLFRNKLSLYLVLYNKIKKGIYLLRCIFIRKNRINFMMNLKYRIIYHSKRYYINSYLLIPENNISIEYKKEINANEKIFKDRNNMQMIELQKELNKAKDDYSNAEKRLKELILENKKIQNINNIIVRDNKQLALKLKNFENNRYDKLEISNSSFHYQNSNEKKQKKMDNKKFNDILKKLIIKKEQYMKVLIYKYFYNYLLKCKIMNIQTLKKNKKTNYFIVKNNNFIINENFIQKNSINNIEANNELKSKKLKKLIFKKNFNSYFYRNTFEKWLLRALVIKNKEFVKEKKKKKKEKFKQRKQRRLYSGYYNDKNDKKYNEEEFEYSNDSDYYEDEQQYNNYQYKYNNKKYYNNDKYNK